MKDQMDDAVSDFAIDDSMESIDNGGAMDCFFQAICWAKRAQDSELSTEEKARAATACESCVDSALDKVPEENIQRILEIWQTWVKDDVPAVFFLLGVEHVVSVPSRLIAALDRKGVEAA